MPVGIYQRTEEHKKKIGNAQRGKKNHFYGKHHAEGAKKRISEAMKVILIGNKHGQGNRGKIRSQELKQKYREARCHIIIKKPTGIERKLISLINDYNLPFRYVGNGEVWLGNRNPDFINTNGAKQVIELLGTYWHPLFDGANRIEHYKQYGFDCLAIWEDELGDKANIIKKIKRFQKQDP